MKTLFYITITFIALILTSCSKDDNYVGSGNMVSEYRNVDSFTKVSSESTFKINIHQGTTQSVEVIADDNIMNKVRTVVSNNELKIYLSEGNYKDITIEVNITMPNLNGLKNIGSGNITVFDLISEGNIDIDNSGSGDISIAGQINTMNIRNEGSGSINGFQFMSTNCDIEIIGSGNCEVYCTNNLDVDIEGGGNVYYKGNPLINSSISGSGSIIDSN